MSKEFLAGALLASLALAVLAPIAVSANHTTGKDIVERAIQVNHRTGAFGTLLAAATCPYFDGAIAGALANTDDITLFAPTDRAFRKLGRQLGLGWRGINPGNVCSVDAVLETAVASRRHPHLSRPSGQGQLSPGRPPRAHRPDDVQRR